MTIYFQSNGGVASAHLVDQLAGNGQSIDDLAFITSLAGGNLELLARGGAGTFIKLNYLDAGGTERTGLAVATGTSSPSCWPSPPRPSRPRPPSAASCTWTRPTVR